MSTAGMPGAPRRAIKFPISVSPVTVRLIPGVYNLLMWFASRNRSMFAILQKLEWLNPATRHSKIESYRLSHIFGQGAALSNT